MRVQVLKAVFAVAAVAFAAVSLLIAQTGGVSARDAVVDLLLFAEDHPINAKAYSSEIRLDLERYLKQFKAYKSKRLRPAVHGLSAGEEEMVYAAWVAYERMLAATSSDPEAARLAREYVDRLRPCYEWEGLHDCPEREAKFAVDQQQNNPRGPFHDYLPLLAAHRWLCAAEAYGYEHQSAGAAQSRRAYERMIPVARQSKSPLIRLAAERLAQRNSCSAN